MNKFIISALLITNVLANHRLQIGDKNEKFRVDLDNAHKLGEVEQRAIKSTVKILNNKIKSLGTGFYYKNIDGEFYFLTNNHVMSKQSECDMAEVIAVDDNFKRREFDCNKIIKTSGKNEKADFTIFTLKETQKVEEIFGNRENVISDRDPQVADEFITAGFGSKKRNKRFDITLSNDSDCIMLVGPTTIILQDYAMKNTISMGCDTSSGDSGSAVFDKNSGELVAILFGSGISKRDSFFDLFRSKDDSKESKTLTSQEIRDHLNEPGYLRFWELGTFASQLNRLDLGLE